jgi:tetrahydromethanopterin S-methyltransferase subunit C
MSREDADRFRDLDEVRASAETDYRLSAIADKANTGLMALLFGVYAAHRLFPHYAVPDLATAFPYVGGLAAAVSIAAYGLDTGVLPTPGAGRGGEL